MASDSDCEYKPAQMMVDNLVDHNRIVVFSEKTGSEATGEVMHLLDSQLIPYLVANLDTYSYQLGTPEKEIRAYLLEKSGQSTFPNIYVHRHHIGDCDDLKKAMQDGSFYKYLSE
ncbi:hypothetical protein MBANPS3_002517 [Mucor bainieri]